MHERFEGWLAAQRTAGRAFTPAQLEWLTMIRDHVASSLGIELDDFDLVPFAEHGGRARAAQVFGGELRKPPSMTWAESCQPLAAAAELR